MGHFHASGDEFYLFEVTAVLKISMFLYIGISLYIGKTATFQNSITPSKNPSRKWFIPRWKGKGLYFNISKIHKNRSDPPKSSTFD